MKRISALFVAVGIAASLSSCSRSNYAFNTTATPAEAVAVATATEATPAQDTPVYESAKVVAHRPAAPVAEAVKETAKPAAAATQPAAVVAPEVAATTEAARPMAKPSLVQRLMLKSVAKKLNKMQQKQATAGTATDSGLLKTGIYVGIGSLIALIGGIIVAAASVSGGSSGGFGVGAILYLLGGIGLTVAVILIIIALVKN